MQRKWSVLLLLVFLFINSCKTDFSIIAPYKPITVVYGLLDPAASVQYIKINKAFLGEGNALVMAQQQDSINYAPGVLSVTLQSFYQGSPGPVIKLDTTTTIPKDPGIFSNPYQLLYTTNQPINQPISQTNGDSTYTLTIYNNSTKQTITSTTPIVGAITDTININPGPGTPIVLTNPNDPIYNVTFLSAANARVYNLVIRFYYSEVQNGDTTSKYVDWNQGIQTSPHLYGGENMQFSFSCAGFYTFLAGQLTASPNIRRFIPYLPFNFMIFFGADDLNTYVDVNQPSIGIIQDKPEFTNITGGIGLFSSRSVLNLYRSMDGVSQDTLINGQYTRTLNFH